MYKTHFSLTLLLAGLASIERGLSSEYCKCVGQRLRLCSTGLLIRIMDHSMSPLEKGFFSERGLDVELHVPSNPNDPPKFVAAKKARNCRFLSTTASSSLSIKGLPIVRIATLNCNTH